MKEAKYTYRQLPIFELAPFDRHLWTLPLGVIRFGPPPLRSCAGLTLGQLPPHLRVTGVTRGL